MDTAQSHEQKLNPQSAVLMAMAIGALVAIGIGTYGAVHPPGTVAINVAGFSSFLAVKTWMATLVLVLAIVQVISALMIYGKIQRGGQIAAFLHRWSGRAAVAASIPVATHCLYIAGFMATDARVLLHSTDDSPGWALPVAGSAAFAALTVLWATSSLWFFTTFGVIF